MSWKEIYATMGYNNNLSIKIITEKKNALLTKKFVQIVEKC